MLRWWVEPPRIQVLTILWLLVIFILSALPGKDLPHVDLLNADKFAHAFVYGVLVILIAFSIVSKRPPFNLFISGMSAIGYGVLMECMQETFFSERTFDWMDVIANTVGVLIGIVIYRLIR